MPISCNFAKGYISAKRLRNRVLKLAKAVLSNKVQG